MFRFKSILSCLLVLSAFIGLVFVIGCSDSAERHKMSDFLQEYNKTLDEYSDALSKDDTAKKADIEGKLKSYDVKWSEMKMKMADQLTPQDLNELDREFQKISQKYKSLVGKS